MRAILPVTLVSLLWAGAAPAQERPAGPLRQRTVYEDLQMFTGVLNQIRVNHPDSMDSHALIIAAIRGMIRAMDPHSYVLVYQPLAADKMKELEAGRLMPVPISFRFVGGSPVVAGTGPGTEAARSDILPGDELVDIEGQPVSAESVEELDIILAGKKGSRVTLGFERLRSDGSRTRVERGVKREKPGEVTAVPTAFMLTPGTGYVRITTFVAEKIADDLRSALERLEAEHIKTLILDLRDNGGGSVDEAAKVASVFLPSGKVIYIQEGRKTELNDTVKVKRSFWKAGEREYSIVLLVNSGTASASELVAGALQDHDRARIVGRPTFGKSLLMRPFPLPDGSLLWMVVGHVKTPCGRVVQRQYRQVTTREYYRAAAAARDTLGRPSCKTAGGRTVYGGGGIYPDEVLAEPVSPPWLERVNESLLPLKWIGAYLGANPAGFTTLEALAANPVLPAGALEDFRRLATREGLTVPDTPESAQHLAALLLPLLAEAKWGESGYYRIAAVLDPEVQEAKKIAEKR